MNLGDWQALRQFRQSDKHFMEVGQIVQHHWIEQIRIAKTVILFAYFKE